MEKHDSTYQTEEERIPLGQSRITVRGFVLPHKDRLSEEEYSINAGPRGWNGGQGFYVYRNRRLLIHGDWLRLGRPNPWTREEQYKLARISLDINNDTDSEWQLDVKKSTARPPTIIRERLTDLAAAIRLPGIGRSTAGAILSISYSLPYPVLDGNVVRVLTRLFALTGNPTRSPLSKELWKLAGQFVGRQFSKSYKSTNGKLMWLETQSRPLPVPRRPDSMISMLVVST